MEEELEDFRRDVIEQVQPRHPIMYDVHNLCDLVASGKLKKLTLPKLKEICSAFELNLPEERKKAPFVDALTKLLVLVLLNDKLYQISTNVIKSKHSSSFTCKLYNEVTISLDSREYSCFFVLFCFFGWGGGVGGDKGIYICQVVL